MNHFTSILASTLLLFSCNGHNPDPDPIDEPGKPYNVETPAFARGADVSWLSEMEKDGKSFKKADGTAADLFDVLKDCGVNAIRLRVWVDPPGGWSGKNDMVRLAVRAAKAGMALMVDFHYSDFFADPSRQTVPSAWEADKNDLEKMCSHVSAHTTEVLKALKDAGVTPAWIQVGNETRNGMLWPLGEAVWKNDQIDLTSFVKLYNAGYDAAKAVFPNAKVMPHLNNAFFSASYGNPMWLKDFKAKGGKFDMIAFSHYPQYESKMWVNNKELNLTPSEVNQYALDYIKSAISTYGVPVIVSEVGVKPAQSQSAALLQSFMDEAKKLNGCKGVFYWEPEVYGGWKPAVYSNAEEIKRLTGKAETWGPYDQGAFTSDGRPHEIMNAFKQ